MRVVPVRPRAIGDLELDHIFTTLVDGQAWMTVGSFGHVQAVPVDDRAFGELVDDTDADLLAAAEANDRPKIGAGNCLERVGRAFDQSAREAPHARLPAGKHQHFVGRRGQDQFDVGDEPSAWCGLRRQLGRTRVGGPPFASGDSREGGQA
ncbi:MAG: hypothetical protein M3539_09040 [Acidobacteriota bacterium]|nr:hypothetical protein [Acidobacteriota bacterium]